MIQNLIINADDYGMSPGVSYGILHGIKKGIISSTTVMMNMEYALEFLPLLKGIDVGVGVHLNITCGKPLTNCPSLTNDDQFKNCRDYDDTINKEELYKEWKAQVDLFIKHFGMPDHLDSHHHMHMKYFDVFQKLNENYHLPYRQETMNDNHFAKLIHDFENDVSIELFKSILEKYDKNVEMFCHPAFIDHYLMHHSSYNLPRFNELHVLTSTEVKDLLKQYKITLTNYKNIKK